MIDKLTKYFEKKSSKIAYTKSPYRIEDASMLETLTNHLEQSNFKTLYEGSSYCVDGETVNKILEKLGGIPNVLNWNYGDDHEGSQTNIVLIYICLLLLKRIEKLEDK